MSALLQEPETSMDADLVGKPIDPDLIPVIDINPWLQGSDKGTVARQVGEACRNMGFFYVSGHGVDFSQIQAVFDQTGRFFDKPVTEKSNLHIKNSGVALRGYTPLFGENTDPEKTEDMKECFDIGPEPHAANDVVTRPFYGANQWPEHEQEFRSVLSGHHDTMVDLGVELTRAIAMSLGLPERYFDPMMQTPISIQRLLHYPPQVGRIEESTLGCGAHTDYGFLTILAQDSVGGLQVMTRKGEWIAAPPIENTFIVNIGDLVQRLTNDVYVANLHRVINTSGWERYSIPFFLDADFDAVIEPVPTCVSDQRPPRYESVTCGDHKFSRYAASFAHLDDTGL